jgi:hypothetical protein
MPLTRGAPTSVFPPVPVPEPGAPVPALLPLGPPAPVEPAPPPLVGSDDTGCVPAIPDLDGCSPPVPEGFVADRYPGDDDAPPLLKPPRVVGLRGFPGLAPIAFCCCENGTGPGGGADLATKDRLIEPAGGIPACTTAAPPKQAPLAGTTGACIPVICADAKAPPE